MSKTQSSQSLPPLVQVLPFTSKTEPLAPKQITKERFPNGLLAWGDSDTATVYGNLFDAVIVTAEEFPFTDANFMKQVVASKSSQVFHVPISEVRRGGIVNEANLIHQPAMEIRMGSVQGTVHRKLASIQPGVHNTRSDELIYHFLLAKKRVLVVCMAGKNRSTATLIRFLLILSLRHPNTKESDMLLAARHPAWQKADWEAYLGKKRKFEIFPLNNVQLQQLDETLRSLRVTTKPATSSKKKA